MRRKSVWSLGAGLLAALCLLTACAKRAEQPAGAENEPRVEDCETVISGTIVRADEKTILLAAADGLYTLPADAGPVAALGSQLAPGNELTVGASGGVAESYPMQLGQIEAARAAGGDDLVGLYLAVVDRLWEQDSGLNGGAAYLAFDLSGAENLTEGEKEAVAWLAASDRGLEPLRGTFDELVEQGFIDGENLLFEDGLLYGFTLTDVRPDSFGFEAQKWRSGLGAYFLCDCKAVLRNGQWSFTVGAEAIS